MFLSPGSVYAFPASFMRLDLINSYSADVPVLRSNQRAWTAMSKLQITLSEVLPTKSISPHHYFVDIFRCFITISKAVVYIKVGNLCSTGFRKCA